MEALRKVPKRDSLEGRLSTAIVIINTIETNGSFLTCINIVKFGLYIRHNEEFHFDISLRCVGNDPSFGNSSTKLAHL